MPSWRSGKTHGFCVTGGHSPIASEPTPSPRLWVAAPGATPALRVEHTTGGRRGHSKPELSTLPESGTFYFALTPSNSALLLQLGTTAVCTVQYIAKMEDVLEVYERPYSPQEPVICVDEKPITLHADLRPPRRRFQDEKRDGITNMSVAGPPMFSVP